MLLRNSDFLFVSSLRLTHSGLTLKIAPGDFVVSVRKHRAHDCMDAGRLQGPRYLYALWVHPSRVLFNTPFRGVEEVESRREQQPRKRP